MKTRMRGMQDSPGIRIPGLPSRSGPGACTLYRNRAGPGLTR